MRFRSLVFALLTSVIAAQPVFSQAGKAISFSVKETAGIRRNAYPVNARIPFAQGTLKDPEHVRLSQEDKEKILNGNARKLLKM